MKHCLVVDHSPALRRVARSILEEMQYQGSDAPDGEAALHACREAMPDLIFLDWHLPHMTGLEFVRTLRALPGGTGPRILFCASEINKAEIAKAMAAGANEF